MNNSNIYAGYRYPTQIISYAFGLYHRFTHGFRNIDELLAARGVTVNYDTDSQWCKKHSLKWSNETDHKFIVPKALWRR